MSMYGHRKEEKLMKKTKFLAALSVVALLALTGCQPANPPVDENEQKIRAIYELYRSSTANPQTYEEWLASVRGPQGEPGHSPVITIGSDGYWYIDGNNTNVKTQGGKGDQGEPGVTPHIGDNGNWFIGETDTGIKATGADGQTPHIGGNGNWFIGETDTGVKAQGDKGDAGVSVTDVQVSQSIGVYGSRVTTYTFKMSEGEDIVRQVSSYTEHYSYRMGYVDAEGHPVLESENPAIPDYTLESQTLSGSMTIDGSKEAATADYVTVGSSNTPFNWNADENRYESGNKGVSSSKSTISFTAVVDITLSLDLTCGGESTYDYTSNSLSSGATMTMGANVGTYFSSSGLPDNADYHHEFNIPAGGSVSYTFQKDSGVNKNMDGAYIYNVKISTDGMPVSPDSYDDYAVVNFNTLGGEIVEPVVVKKGETAEMPNDPAANEENKGFSRWYDSSAFVNDFSFADPIASDVTAYGRFGRKVRLTIHGYAEENPTVMPTVVGRPLVLENPTPREGDIFLGWFTTPDFKPGSEFDPNTGIKADADIYAKLVELRGYSKEKALIVDELEAGENLNAEFETNEEYGNTYFYSYSATAASIITVSAEFAKVSGGNLSGSTKVYGLESADELPNKTGRSATNKKVAKITTSSDENFTQISVDANETVIIALSLGSATYGTGTVKFSRLANDANVTPANAIVAGDSVPASLVKDNEVRYYKYIATETASRYVSITSNDKWTSVDVLTLNSETGEFNSRIGYVSATKSTSGKVFDFEAGTTYYFAVTTNDSAGANYSISVSNTSPEGASRLNPKALVLGAAEVVTDGKGGDNFYAKFVVEADGNFVIKRSSTYSVYVYKDASFTGTTQTFAKTIADEKMLFASLEAGTYYVKCSSSASNTIAVAAVTDGAIVEAPIALAEITAESAAMDFVPGKYYKYKPTASGKVNVTVPAGAKFETFSKGSSKMNPISTVDASRSAEPVTAAINNSANQDTYVLVTAAGGAASVNVSFSAYVGPLTGKTFLDQQFNGTRNGSSYYKIRFSADGFFYESNTSVSDVSNVRDADGVTYMSSSGYPLVATNGNEAFMVDTNGNILFLSKRNIEYGSGKYGAQYAKTSNFTNEAGICVYSMTLKTSAEDTSNTRIYAAVINGVCYFDVAVTFADEEKTDISSNGTVFSATIGGVAYTFTKGSSNLTYEIA